MKNTLLNLLIPERYKRYKANKKQQKVIEEWEKAGRPVPPPHFIKQEIIQDYQNRFEYNVLVETGTYLGEMVEAQKNYFNKIISIELSEKLYADAKQKFSNDGNVFIVHGDSGKIMPKVISTLNEPAIFWLDGHYSAGITAKGEKECPIFEELHAIFNGKKLKHVILIDDARLFNGTNDYPTIQELREYVHKFDSTYTISVEDDIIRFAK